MAEWRPVVRAFGAEPACTTRPPLVQVMEAMDKPCLYLVGAYHDPQGIGLQICHALLNTFHKLSDRGAVLALACLHTTNTLPGRRPATVHLAVDCKTGEPSPSCFEDRGPELSRRHAYRQCRHDKSLLSIWNSSDSVLVIPGFDAALPSWHTMYLERMMALPDHRFLQESSTSPDVERDVFVADIRGSYQFLIDAQESGTLLEPMAFRWSSGKWQVATDVGHAFAAKEQNSVMIIQ
eukprot:355658-Chlamydomonas_euryale.AAC.6